MVPKMLILKKSNGDGVIEVTFSEEVSGNIASAGPKAAMMSVGSAKLKAPKVRWISSRVKRSATRRPMLSKVKSLTLPVTKLKLV